MTPKEKALELRDKYFDILDGDNLHLNYLIAEKCAMVAVDEIIVLKNEDTESFYTQKWAIIYWNDVKKELEKL